MAGRRASRRPAWPRRWGGDQGFTFLVVIWALAILIVLAMVFGRSTSAHLKATRNAVENARAEALADAGIELAVLDLSRWRTGGGEVRFPRDGRAVGCGMDNGDRIVVAVEDEVGKVDLNAAGEDLVEAALIAAGMEPREAERLAQRILDYRDSDDQRRPHGAEAGEYLQAGRTGPKNRPLDAIEEVEQVLGAPPGLADALRPYATIYSSRQTIDARLAAPRLAAALATRGGGAMELEAAARSRDRAAGASSGGAAEMAGAAGGRAFRIVAEAHAGRSAVFVREAVVEFVSNRPDGYMLRRWRKGERLMGNGSVVDKAFNAAGLPPC